MAGRRRGRPRRARHLVQRHGRQPAGEAAGARGAVQGAAPVRLRRLARAADPDDHDQDGGGDPLRVQGAARPRRRPLRRAAAEPDRAVRDPAHRPARDQQARRQRGHARRRARGHVRHRAQERRRRAAARRAPRLPHRVPAARPGRAWPRWTGAGWSGSCATCWSTRWSTARDGTSWSPWRRTGTRSPSRSATTASGWCPGEEQLVFERFWRADPARARTTGGTGLGLAISLEDAHLHGGWLQAWGEKGRGSVFRLTVPRVAGQPLAGSPLPLGPDEAEVVTTRHHAGGRPRRVCAGRRFRVPARAVRRGGQAMVAPVQMQAQPHAAGRRTRGHGRCSPCLPRSSSPRCPRLAASRCRPAARCSPTRSLRGRTRRASLRPDQPQPPGAGWSRSRSSRGSSPPPPASAPTARWPCST